jgi:hypothetical protein
VGVQETKKESFIDGFLNTAYKWMSWISKPAKGTASGILVGLRSSCFTLVSWHEFNSCVSIIIRNIVTILFGD